jgi:hypothetical protein
MVLDDLRQYLIQMGIVGGATGWPCFIGYLPDDQDRAVALYLTGGMAADTLGHENELPTVQVRVRAGKFALQECESKWREIYNALDQARPGQLMPDPLDGYGAIEALATAPLVWYDEKLRCNMTQNYRIIKLRP